jgi:hypothetical protein
MVTAIHEVPGALALLAVLALSTGCNSIPEDAFRLSESTFETRTIQTRTYERISEERILSASASALQDMGYAIDEIETELGVISASKTVDATKRGRIAGLAFFDFLCLLGGGGSCKAVASADDEEKVTLTLVAKAAQPGSEICSVRITMQHLIWNNAGQIKTREPIVGADVYQALFFKLEKSVFLEMNP